MSTPKLFTKPGQHGTLYRYVVAYQDDSGDPSSRDTVRLWAYIAEHAEERFLDGPDSEGWEVLSVRRLREAA